MLDDGFVAKARSLKPRLSLPYVEAQMNDRNVSWVYKVATHSCMSAKLTKKLGLTNAYSGQTHQCAVWKR
jgi:hypothetical protein